MAAATIELPVASADVIHYQYGQDRHVLCRATASSHATCAHGAEHTHCRGHLLSHGAYRCFDAPARAISSISETFQNAGAPATYSLAADDRKLKLTKATVQETRAVEPTLDARASKVAQELDQTLALMALGDWAVGKSALLHSLLKAQRTNQPGATLHHDFANNPATVPRVHADLRPWRQLQTEVDGTPKSRRDSGARRSFRASLRRRSGRRPTGARPPNTLVTTLELLEDSSRDQFQMGPRKQYFLPGRVDIFLLCFAVDSRETLAHVTTRWFPEVKKLQDLCKAHGVPAPVAVLVGLKTDLRHNRDNNAVIMDYAPAVSPASGRQTAAKLGLPYVECSCRALEVQDRSDAPDSTTGLDDLPASSSGGRLAERLRQARQDIADAGETLDVASSDNDPALVLAAALATWLEAQATNAT